MWCTAAVTLGPPPVPPEKVLGPTLPLLPILAPLVLSVVMAIVFQSPVALMMGVLGPLMVGGGWWASRRQAFLRHETESEEFATAILERASRVDVVQRGTLLEATRAHPSVAQWSSQQLWRGPHGVDTRVRIGQALWIPPDGHALAGEGGIAGFPAVVDSTVGLAFVAGDDAEDLWRCLLIQWRAHSTSGWLPALDDGEGDLPRDAWGPSRIVWVARPSEVPDECRVVIIHHSNERAEVHTPTAAPWRVTLDRLSHAQALWALRSLKDSGVAGGEPVIDSSRRDQLWATLSPGGPAIDLVAEGPHAIVWGATGSGKSQTVVTLVTSLAHTYTPRQVVFVIIDFKGGAGLRPLMELPHTSGCVTDIGHTPSARALRGVRAEILRRERLLAQHGVAECSALENSIELPRLVVVIDEMAWLLTNFPQWGDGLHDVLARGRSLGVHVIVSSQRVSGVISGGMMANISLRLCGRVSDAGELLQWMPDASTAVVGAMRNLRPGQVVLAGASLSPRIMDVSPRLADVAAAEATPWRVWVDPLPARHPWEPGQWALAEHAETQEHQWATPPLVNGSIVIVGDAGSGRSTAARALAALTSSAVWAPSSPAGLWACVQENQGSGRVLVVDDCSATLQAGGAEGEAFMLEALQGYDGVLVMVASPSHRLTRALARLAPQILVMSLTKPEDRDLWGATQRTTPGSGLWQGADVQVVYPAPEGSRWEPQCTPGGDPVIVVTGQDTLPQWQPVTNQVVPTDVVFVGVPYREVRLNTAGRLWIPPLNPPEGFVWVWRRGEPRLASSERWLR